MGFLSNMLGRKGSEARQTIGNLENRDLMQAIVYGCYYIAAADGDLEPAEIEKVDRLLQNNPKLQGFGSELHACVEKARADFEQGGARVIRMNALRELADVKHSPDQAETVLVMMITTAEADGEIEPAEMEALERAAQALGVSLKSIL